MDEQARAAAAKIIDAHRHTWHTMWLEGQGSPMNRENEMLVDALWPIMADAVMQAAEEKVLESPLVAGCISVVAELVHTYATYGATSRANVVQAVAQAVKEERQQHANRPQSFHTKCDACAEALRREEPSNG